MTALSTAVERGQYELAALRLLLGIVNAIDTLETVAPRVRAELLALLTTDDA